ncbi:MAG: MotA/TolQ/ExbB proton channel family protein [Cocleimonas sp.]
MDTFLQAGGWLMIPLVLSSLVAIAVILALFMNLKKSKVLPEGLVEKAQKLARSGKMTPAHIQQVRDGSLLGSVLAAGLATVGQPRHLMKESIEESGRHAIHKMDKYMTTLGTIAAIAPLLGLLGTVVGMIVVFNEMLSQGGVGNPADLAGGISQALVTTAFGISIAVPALIFHRFFRGKINDFAVDMEKEAVKLLEMINVPPVPARRQAGATKPAARKSMPQARTAAGGIA